LARLIFAGLALALAMGAVPAEAKRKPKPAAAPVPPPPSVKQAVELWRLGDYAGAVAMWQPFADAGDADAMFNIGQAYKLGRSVPKDSLVARDWYRKAAAKGHLPAEANLGILLFQAGDKAEAIRWLKMAADRNEMRAQYVLGVAMWNGDGTPKNLALAYAYLTRAAAQGLPDATPALNSLTGVIGPVDRANGWAASTSLAAGKGIPPHLSGNTPPVVYAGANERFNRDDVMKPLPKPEVVAAVPVPVVPPAPASPPPAMAVVTPPPAPVVVQKPVVAPAPASVAAVSPSKPAVLAPAPKPVVVAAAPPMPKPVPVTPSTAVSAPKPVVVASAPVAAPKPAERPIAPPVTTVAIPAAEPAKPVETAVAKPAPPRVEVAKVEPPKPKPKPVETAAAEPQPKPKPTGWRVQLGAFSERQKAEAAWTDVKTKQKTLVANAKPIYEASGNVTKLQIGPYPNKSAARDACAKIAFSGRACFVTEG
jgi:TPR repeat protein